MRDRYVMEMMSNVHEKESLIFPSNKFPNDVVKDRISIFILSTFSGIYFFEPASIEGKKVYR